MHIQQFYLYLDQVSEYFQTHYKNFNELLYSPDSIKFLGSHGVKMYNLISTLLNSLFSYSYKEKDIHGFDSLIINFSLLFSTNSRDLKQNDYMFNPKPMKFIGKNYLMAEISEPEIVTTAAIPVLGGTEIGW